MDVAVVEVGRRRRPGTPRTSSTAPVAVVTNVSVDHVEYLGRPARRSRRRRPGSSSRAARSCWARPIRSSRAIFEARGAGADRAARPRLRVVANGSRTAVGCSTSSRPTATVRRALPSAARRAPGRQRGDRARPRPRLPRRAAPDDVVADAFAALRRRVGSRSSAINRWCCSTARTTSPARTRCVHALDEEFATAPRTLVVGLLREKEPHEMLEALGVDGARRVICLPPRRARARSTRGGRDAAVDLGLDPEQIDVVDLVPEAVARALEVTPAGRPGHRHRFALHGRRGPLRPRRRTPDVSSRRIGTGTA